MILIIASAVVLVAILAVAVASYITSDKVAPIHVPGSRIVITGGSDGLGLVLSTNLVQQGANLVIIARNQTKLNKAVASLKKVAVDKQQVIKSISADVSDFEGIQAAIVKASDLLGGGIDVLINNAGITHPERFDTMDVSWFEKCMNINYFGNVYAVKAVLPIMKNQKSGGRVLSISSVAGLFGCMGYSAYAPSKAAIVSLYEALQQENYAFKISFSVATPCSIGTESFYEEEQKIKPEETLELEKDDPVLSAEEVARPILQSLQKWSFLVSPSGFNSHVMTTSCAGWGPASFSEAFCQIMLAGVLRFIALFAFNSKAKSISLRVRSREVNHQN